MIKTTVEYSLIKNYYADRETKRSKVPLINHINEGLVVLDHLDASLSTKKAFCLHPLLQDDDALTRTYWDVSIQCDPLAILLAMEYRSVANEFLSDKIDDLFSGKHIEQYLLESVSTIVRLSPIPEVNDMLIADKVQNRKDFLTYHSRTHPRASQLDLYFRLWLTRLGIDELTYQGLCAKIDATKNCLTLKQFARDLGSNNELL